ncbi:MAG: hypothetical protein EPO28_07605, partial [Saprospiraceae bacterium]
MEQLKELVNVVTKNKAKRIDIVGQEDAGDSLILKLYDALAAGNFASDDEAIAHFYPGHDKPAPNYNRLKRKLRQRLLNTLFFIDVNQTGFNETQKAYYSSYKEVTAIKILKGRGATKVALPLAEKLLSQALKFEFTDIAVNV